MACCWLVRLRGHLGEVWSVAISPDGRMLASGSKEGTTKYWDATTRHEQPELPKSGIVTGFSSDSRLLVADGSTESKIWQLTDRTIRTIPLEKYRELHFEEYPELNVFRDLFSCRDVYGIEPQAVYGRTDGLLELWNLATMSRVTSWRAHDSAVATATFSPDGRFIATSGEKGDIRLWQTRTRREVRRFEALDGKLICLTFSPDGQVLAGSEVKDMQDSRVGIWNVQSGRLLCEPDIHGAVFAVAFSPDSKLLATAHQDNTAQLWDIPSGEPRGTLMGHIQAVMSVAFSPDGKTLATGADDLKVKLWNIATQQELTTLELPGWCRSVKFSPDGCTLAVGSHVEPEPRIRLWEAPSFEQIAAVEGGKRAESKQP